MEQALVLSTTIAGIPPMFYPPHKPEWCNCTNHKSWLLAPAITPTDRLESDILSKPLDRIVWRKQKGRTDGQTDKQGVSSISNFVGQGYKYLHLLSFRDTVMAQTVEIFMGDKDLCICHFADNIFKCIFLNENAWIAINISLKFVPNGPISNIPALVQIMAWRRSGYKPLSEPMMVRSPMHICVTRPQWVKEGQYHGWWLIGLFQCSPSFDNWQQNNKLPYQTKMMERFSHYWPSVRGLPQSLMESPSQRSINTKISRFLSCWPEQAVEQTVHLMLLWDAFIIMECHCNGNFITPWFIYKTLLQVIMVLWNFRSGAHFTNMD